MHGRLNRRDLAGGNIVVVCLSSPSCIQTHEPRIEMRLKMLFDLVPMRWTRRGSSAWYIHYHQREIEDLRWTGTETYPKRKAVGR